MSTALETSSAAILVYTETVRRARRIADIVNRAATAMRNWEQMQVTETAGEFPEEFRRSTYSENHVKGSERPGALASIRATAVEFTAYLQDLEEPAEEREAGDDVTIVPLRPLVESTFRRHQRLLGCGAARSKRRMEDEPC